jgi:hypothetical protein
VLGDIQPCTYQRIRVGYPFSAILAVCRALCDVRLGSERPKCDAEGDAERREGAAYICESRVTEAVNCYN